MLFKLKQLYLRLIKLLLNPNLYAKLVGVNLGKNCKLGTKELGSEPYLISIGDNFYSSSNIQFITHDGSINVLRNLHEHYRNADVFGRINIGNNVFIGYGCIILPNTNIGNNVIIGAGSVVKGDVPDNSVYAGVPAKYICSLLDYERKINNRVLHTKNLNPQDKENFIRSLFLKSE